MTPEQLSILNALVTFAAENVPGGLNPEEREVAKIVGRWALGEPPLSTPLRVEHVVDRFKALAPPKFSPSDEEVERMWRHDHEAAAEAIAGTRNEGRIKYLPVLVGFSTEKDEKIVIYRDVDNPHEMHIRRPDNELWALGPASEVAVEETQLGSERFVFHVISPAWSGQCVGTRADILREEAIRFA